MLDIQEPIIYTFILTKTDGNKYMGWSKAPEKPNDVTGLKWFEWNKELPDDIDTKDYKYVNKKLTDAT